MRGARLEQADDWVRTTDLVLANDLRRYVAAGNDERDIERRAEEERRVREVEVERRSTRRLRSLVAVFALAALVAGSLTLIATGQGRRAEREATISAARELAAASVASLDGDAELAVLLAVEAVERSRAVSGVPVPEAEEALHRAIAASRIVATIPSVRGPIATSVDGSIAAQAVGAPGRVSILDASGASMRAIAAHEGAITDMTFTPDGTKLVTTGADGWLRMWDAERGSLVWERHGTGEARGITLDASGSLVAARWPEAGRVLVAHGDTGRAVRIVRWVARTCARGAEPERSRPRDQRTGTSGVEAGRIVPVTGGASGVTFRAPQWRGINGELTWSPDGRFVSGSAYVWDTTTGELVHTAREHDDIVVDSAWSADGTRLVTGGSYDGTAKVWTFAPGSRVASRSPPPVPRRAP